MANQRTLTASEQAAISVITRLQAGHVLPCISWSALQMSEIEIEKDEDHPEGRKSRSRNVTFSWRVGNDISTHIKLHTNSPTGPEEETRWSEHQANYWIPVSILFKGGSSNIELKIDGEANVGAFLRLISGGPLFAGVGYPGIT